VRARGTDMAETRRRRSRDQILTDLADHITELADPIHHTEQYQVRHKTWYQHRTHQTDQPSLLDQLRDATTDKPHTENEQADRVFPRNSPHTDLDATNRLDAINRAVAQWRLEFDLKPRGKQTAQDLLWHTQEITRLFPNPLPRPIHRLRVLAAGYAVHIAAMVEPDLRAFVGHAPTLDTTTLLRLETDTARWRTWCRIVAGWERPAFQPSSPCPHCGNIPDVHAGLRVRAEAAAAVCLSCDSTWAPDGVPIEILGQHIRQVREAVDAARRAALAEQGPYRADQNRGGRS
jgi:hypothetical protein